MRLQGEWDRASKPRSPTAEALAALALSFHAARPLLVLSEKGATSWPAWRASAQASTWYAAEQMQLINRLGSFNGVRAALTEGPHGHPPALVGSVLLSWLDRACPTCKGRRWLETTGTGRFSTKVCGMCRGLGERRLQGAAADLMDWFDESVNRTRMSMASRLR